MTGQSVHEVVRAMTAERRDFVARWMALVEAQRSPAVEESLRKAIEQALLAYPDD